MDFHKDSLKPIEDQEADQNGGAIDKKAMKKKKKADKEKGNGAEDIDLGPSKKQLKKLKKAEKKKKKDSSEIDF